ncbi:polymer-forming cytoskeletal protein [Dysgonomonas sp. Marseille-P4677]|uniref:bactofilin family protein n=1 Tax=Dysgonomonas sp. Marseille-P4677 TaxID=2364790 RepID=UPI0019128F19|nr:polymer-forming cytoskeletal protein [Dysgonomonas sp. Marseille-P4677]MBK5720042.1 polymer-forming cytoskeletal protein [Dysgonomonas sp. Marseille-P4677]
MAKIKEVIAIAANTHNILSSGTHIIGDVTAEKDLRIDSTIEGNIICKGKIIIGTEGSVIGNIESVNIEILGRVKGNLTCRETLILRASAFFSGEVKTGIIEIEPGANFEGSCIMFTEK